MNIGIDTAVFWAVMIALIWFLYGPWQNFWVAWYRDEVFATRDKLFDAAIRGEAKFTDNDYRSSRDHLNIMIRFAERNTWTHVALLSLGFKVIRRSYSGNLSVSNAHVNPHFEQIMSSANRALFIFMIARAPMLWPLVGVIGLIEFWQIAARGTNDISRSFFSKRFLELERIAACLSFG